MKLRGAFSVAVLILVSFLGTEAKAAPNADDFFSSTSVSKITITITEDKVGPLAREPKTAVEARFAIENENAGISFKNLPVKFNLKGTSTLRQNPSLINNRPSLRVKFKRDGVMKLGFLGTLQSLTLNSMTQDVSKIHEYSA
jgi:hypothetical protein